MLGGEEEGEKKKSSKREGHTLVGDVRGLGDREEELSRIFWANTRVLVYLGAKKKKEGRSTGIRKAMPPFVPLQPKLWQHPFVNVFRLCDVDSWREATKDGDVTTSIDRDINKKVLRIRGAVPAANSVTLPRDRHAHTLNLTGRYLYIQARFPHGKYFVVHIDVLGTGNMPYRVSISNLYKGGTQRKQATRAYAAPSSAGRRRGNLGGTGVGLSGTRSSAAAASSSGNSIQLAFPFATDRWTMVALNLPELLRTHLDGAEYASIRSLQFCANMDIKSCFTSDSEYTTMATAPRDIMMNARVAEMMDTVWLPEVPPKVAYGQAGKVQEATARNSAAGPVTVQDEDSGLQNEEADGAGKSVCDNSDFGVDNDDEDNDDDYEDEAVLRTRDAGRSDILIEDEDVVDDEDEDEEEERDVNGNPFSSAGNVQPRAEVDISKRVMLKQPKKCVKKRTAAAPATRASAADVSASVDYLTLTKVVGFDGSSTGMGVVWAPDRKTVLYNVGNTVVEMDVANGHQSFLYGHTASVSCAAFSVDGGLLATAQSGKEAIVRLWRRTNRLSGEDEATSSHEPGFECVAVLCEHSSGMSSIDISQDGRALAAVGLDALGRQTIVVWDISSLHASLMASADPQFRFDKENTNINLIGANIGALVSEDGIEEDQPRVLVRHNTEYHVRRLRFSPFEEDHLMTCGRDSVRVYRFRSGRLRGVSIKVGEPRVARTPPGVSASDMVKTIFTDIAFEIGYGITSLDRKHVFVSSVSGSVYQINYGLRCVECIYQLHNSAINSIDINEGFCVTGSDDKYVRVWPTDFSDYVLEAEHDSGVNVVGFSGDGLQLVACTDSGSVGVLDIPSQQYTTLVRSHNETINAMSASTAFAEFVTVSNDGSIRVWSISSGQQLFEFKVPNEVPMCAAYHPHSRVIAVGFNTGCVRVFDVESTTLVQEHRQHDGEVLMVEFSPSASMLVSGGAEGNVCVYSPEDGYLPVKFLATSVRARRMLLCVSPDSRLLATVGLDSARVLVFDTSSLTLKHKIIVDSSVIVDMRFAPDSDELYILTQDNSLLRFGVVSGLLTAKLPDLHRSAGCETFALDRAGRLLMTGGRDGTLKVWECAASKFGRRPQSYIGQSSKDFVVSVCFAEDRDRRGGSFALTAAGDAVHIWQVRSSKDGAHSVRLVPEANVDNLREAIENMELPSRSSALPIPPDARLSDGGNRGALQQRHAISPNLVTSVGEDAVLTLAHVIGYDGRATNNLVWSPASGRIAFSCMNLVVISDLASRRQRHVTKMVTELNTMAMSADGSVVATGAVCCDGTATVPIHVWDVESCRCIQIFRVHLSAVKLLAFSPDANLLLSVDASDTLAVWDLQSSSLVANSKVKGGTVTGASWIPDVTPSFQFIVSTSLNVDNRGGSRRRSSSKSMSAGSTGGTCGLNLWTIQGGSLAVTSFTCESTQSAAITERFAALGACITAMHMKDCWNLVATDAANGLWYCNLQEGIELVYKCELDFPSMISLLRWSDGDVFMVGGDDANDVLFLDVDLDKVDGDVENRAQIKSRRLELDGDVRGAAFDFGLYEGVVGTDSGSIWYINNDADVIPVVTAQTTPTALMIACPKTAGPNALMLNADLEGNLNVYDMESKLRVMRFFPPDGGEADEMIASALGTDAEDAAHIVQVQGEPRTCSSLAVSPSGSECAAGFDDGSLRNYDLATGRPLAVARQDAAVLGLAYDGSSTRIVAGSARAEIAVFSSQTLELLFRCADTLLSSHGGSTFTRMSSSTAAGGGVRALAVDFADVDGSSLTTVMYPTSIEVYEIQWRQQKLVRIGITKRLNAEDAHYYQPPNRSIGAASVSASSASGKEQQVLRPSVNFSPQDKSTLIYLYPSIDGAIHYYNYITGILYRQLKVVQTAPANPMPVAAAVSRQVYCMALSVLGDVAVGCCDGVVAIYNRREQRWECIGIHPGVVMSMAFRADGKELWTTTVSGAILVFTVKRAT